MDFLTYFNDLDNVPLSPADISSYFSFSMTPGDENSIYSNDSPIAHVTKKRRTSDHASTSTTLEFDNRHQIQQEIQAQAQAQPQHRRLWVKNRSQAWWDRMSRPDVSDHEFRSAFRMSRATFDSICDELSAAVAKEDTTLRNAIPVRQRVAVCIWRLATGEPLRVVSTRFGLGISTCHKLILEVCAAIKTVLMPKYIHWPNIESTKSGFETLSGIPDVVGAMYTSHVPIVAPKTRASDYLNRRQTERNQKTTYSVTIQGVVDSTGVFTDVCIGWPGGMTDEQVFDNSGVQRRVDGGWLVGGIGCPLTDGVLVPFTHTNLTWSQHMFNEKAAEARKVAFDAFGRMKGRWKCLQKRTEVKLEDLPTVLGACCVLHNVCEIRGEGMGEEAWCDLVDDDVAADNPVRSVAAVQMREKVAHELLHGGRVGLF